MNVEGRKRPTSTSTLGFDCVGKLLFIEAGRQQKTDRYLCTWSPAAPTSKHIHMHIEHISSFPSLHIFFMIFKQISMPCEHKHTQSENPFQAKDQSGSSGLRHRGETKGGQRGVAVCGEVHSLQGNLTRLSLYSLTKVWHWVGKLLTASPTPKKKKKENTAGKNTRLPSEK